MANINVIKSSHVTRSRNQGFTPFIIAMINRDGTIVNMPYPSQSLPVHEITKDEYLSNDKIYGVELMVNPASISNSMSKIINRTPTMTATVEDIWGEELDTVTFQGSTATFVTGGTDIRATRLYDSGTSPIQDYLLKTKYVTPGEREKYCGVRDTEPGVTVSQRRNSASYIQFLRIVDIFRSNGCLFDENGLVATRNYIWLSFGSTAYRGLFESLDITEDASNPYRFLYTITFKAEETVYSYTDPGLTWKKNV